MSFAYNLWNRDISNAAEIVKTKFSANAADYISLADDICENRFMFRGHWEMERTNIPVQFMGKIDWDKTPNNDPEWVFAFNRHSFLIVLGKAWLFTGDDKYPKAAECLLKDWILNVPLTEESKKTTWRSIETGLRCENWLRAFSLFEGSSFCHENMLEAAATSLHTHAQWLIEAHTPFQKLSNWGVLQDHGLLLLGLAFGEENWCDIAAKRLTEAMHHQLMADGTHWEQSPLYHCEVLHCCLDSVHTAKKMNYTLQQSFLDDVHRMSVALAKMLRPDGLLICQSDSDEVDARDLIALAAYLFEDSSLKAYARGALYEENIWDFSDNISAYDNIPLGTIAGSCALADSGNYQLWDDDEKPESSGFLHFHCGTLGSGHGHADLLHVDLTCNKESVLIDSGRFTYVDSPIREALKNPAAHNTILVDEKDFTSYISSWKSAPIAEPIRSTHRFTKHVDYVCAAHLGYQKQGVFTRRRVLRLGVGLWVIWDDFHTTDDYTEHVYDRYFHFAAGGSAVLQNDRAIFTGHSCSAQLVIAQPHSTLSIERTPVSSEYNLLQESDCLKIRSSHCGNIGLATVISTHPGQNPPHISAEIIPLKLASTGEALCSKIGAALKILRDNEEWTIMLLNTEIISEVSLFEANGKLGYGKTIVFGPSIPNGICMDW